MFNIQSSAENQPHESNFTLLGQVTVVSSLVDQRVSVALGMWVVIFFSFFASATEVGVTVDVDLSPAGAFKAKTKSVEGHAFQTATGVRADKVVVDLRKLETGIGLRDKHLKEKLETSKFPLAILSSAKGSDGKGTARITIKGIEKEYQGTYKIEGKFLSAEFKVHLPDLKIQKIKYMGVGVDEDVIVHVTVPIKPAKPDKAVK